MTAYIKANWHRWAAAALAAFIVANKVYGWLPDNGVRDIIELAALAGVTAMPSVLSRR